MKRKMKWLPLLLMVALLAVGCGEKTPTPEQIIKASAEAMAQTESYSFNMDMQMTMDMGEMGQVDMSMLTQADAVLDPLAIKMESETTFSADGQAGSMPITQYIVSTDTGVVLYQNVMDQQWYQMAIDDPALVEAMQMDPAENMDLYLQSMESVTLLGEENVGDVACYKLEVTLAQDAFDEIMSSFSGLTDTMDQATKDAMEATLGEIGGLKTTLWIDKETQQMVKETLDMSEVMTKAIQETLAAYAPEEAGAFGDCTMLMEITYRNYNSVEAITLPEEAKNAVDLSQMAQ